MSVYPSELSQSDFTQTPKVFDTVYVVGPVGKNVVIMFDAIMLLIAIIDQSVIDPTAIAINDCIGISMTLCNW